MPTEAEEETPSAPAATNDDAEAIEETDAELKTGEDENESNIDAASNPADKSNEMTTERSIGNVEEDEDAPAPSYDDKDDDEIVINEDEIVNAVQVEYPEATLAECQRFVRSCRHNCSTRRRTNKPEYIQQQAEQLMESYLDWRSCFGMDYGKDDEAASDAVQEDYGLLSAAAHDSKDWLWAAEKALGVMETQKKVKELEAQAKLEARKNRNKKKKDKDDGKKVASIPDIEQVLKEEEEAAAAAAAKENGDGEENANGDAANGDAKKDDTKDQNNKPKPKPEDLAQLLFLHKDDGDEQKPLKDKDGFTILHCIPAQVDRTVIDTETHANALAFYMDRIFDRSTDERFTVAIDLRPGVGWPNPLAVSMINFARKVTNILQGLYPERCERLIIYPLPRIAAHVWRAVKVFMQKEIADKVIIAPGPAVMKSPMPKEELLQYIDADVLEKLDAHRTNRFKAVAKDEKDEDKEEAETVAENIEDEATATTPVEAGAETETDK